MYMLYSVGSTLHFMRASPTPLRTDKHLRSYQNVKTEEAPQNGHRSKHRFKNTRILCYYVYEPDEMHRATGSFADAKNHSSDA